ncbi:hypothetical protein [Nostoc sp.]
MLFGNPKAGTSLMLVKYVITKTLLVSQFF